MRTTSFSQINSPKTIPILNNSFSQRIIYNTGSIIKEIIIGATKVNNELNPKTQFKFRLQILWLKQNLLP
jgi:hypothetical protein